MWYIWTAFTVCATSLKPYLKRFAYTFGFGPFELQLWAVFAKSLVIPMSFCLISFVPSLKSILFGKDAKGNVTFVSFNLTSGQLKRGDALPH